MRGICMTFPGVKALDNVDFTLRKGEIRHRRCTDKKTAENLDKGGIKADKKSTHKIVTETVEGCRDIGIIMFYPTIF